MKHLGLSAVLALTLSATSLHALSDEEGEEEVEGAGTEKVVLCHKGRKSISVGAPGLAAHLAHGDTEGACEGAVEPGNGGENGGYDGSAAVVLMRCGVPEVGRLSTRRRSSPCWGRRRRSWPTRRARGACWR